MDKAAEKDRKEEADLAMAKRIKEEEEKKEKEAMEGWESFKLQ